MREKSSGCIQVSQVLSSVVLNGFQLTAGGRTVSNTPSNFILPNSSSSSSANVNNFVTTLPRTGGPAIITILSLIALFILRYISFKVYKKLLNKADLSNDKMNL